MSRSGSDPASGLMRIFNISKHSVLSLPRDRAITADAIVRCKNGSPTLRDSAFAGSRAFIDGGGALRWKDANRCPATVGCAAGS